jgi:hypothetical protein
VRQPPHDQSGDDRRAEIVMNKPAAARTAAMKMSGAHYAPILDGSIGGHGCILAVRQGSQWRARRTFD